MANSETLGRDGRPSPEALLNAAEQEGRGRLKIFLGAAPGVGKTYEMLMSAQARRREGIDVVVAIVETHGRRETLQLVGDLEVMPRRSIEYKGRLIEEMDLDAILARQPKLALVDELAHTNAPGSRHPKRYLDVEELLAAGIDVYTTLNIQHVESLNDVVAQITRIRVRETVPDGILDRADEIEVVDLTPEDLIQRLREGKVYVPHQAERALKHYFSPGNLTALRELALRRTAQRVDDQMFNYMRAHAISGPWPAGERVMVCISERPACAALVRYARRLADRLQAKWTALYVESTRHYQLDEAERDRVADCLRLAEKLGADTMTIPARGVVEEILVYARENNITQIVIGKSERSRWFELLHGSVVHDLVRRAGNISVHVIAGDDRGEGVAPKTVATRAPGEAFEPYPYLMSAALVAVATGLGMAIRQFLEVSSIAMVYLTAVLIAAIRFGLLPSLFASLVSVLAYNFFFLPPLYTFTIADPENVVVLFFFLIVALITSNITSRTRNQMLTARSRAKTTAELYSFSRKLAGIASLDDLLWATAYQIASMLRSRVVILLPEEGQITLRAGYPPEDQLSEGDLAAASWAWTNNRPAGHGADTLPGAQWLFLPLRTARGTVGVLGVARDAPHALLTPDERRLVDALADQAGVAIERISLAAEIDQTRILHETERLRSALLTSISHDLRTPLASVLGALTSLRSYERHYDPETREELLRTAQEEAERLNRFVGNLLDITRLESGALEVKRDAVDLADIVGSTVRRAANILARHEVKIDLGPDLPMLRLDFVLFEQVLFNLLDNAAKYSPAGSTISIEATQSGGDVIIAVADEGIGIPAEDLERIFDKFYRVKASDRQRAGTGLGLAICRGFIEAHGGTITAANRAAGAGAVFTVRLPVEAAAQQPRTDERG
jgi:two-component system sensor histidine kinase KdpD